MEFINRLLHRKTSGGGGGRNTDSPNSLSTKASENSDQNKSEAYISNKVQTDKSSSIRSPTDVFLSELNTAYNEKESRSNQQIPQQVSNVEVEGEEEDNFEDAKENKLSITVLANDFNKFHLSTPIKVCSTNTNCHEFADNIQYGAETLGISDSNLLFDSSDASNVSQNRVDNSKLSCSMLLQNQEVKQTIEHNSEEVECVIQKGYDSDNTKENVSISEHSNFNCDDSADNAKLEMRVIDLTVIDDSPKILSINLDDRADNAKPELSVIDVTVIEDSLKRSSVKYTDILYDPTTAETEIDEIASICFTDYAEESSFESNHTSKFSSVKDCKALSELSYVDSSVNKDFKSIPEAINLDKTDEFKNCMKENITKDGDSILTCIASEKEVNKDENSKQIEKCEIALNTCISPILTQSSIGEKYGVSESLSTIYNINSQNENTHLQSDHIKSEFYDNELNNPVSSFEKTDVSITSNYDLKAIKNNEKKLNSEVSDCNIQPKTTDMDNPLLAPCFDNVRDGELNGTKEPEVDDTIIQNDVIAILEHDSVNSIEKCKSDVNISNTTRNHVCKDCEINNCNTTYATDKSQLSILFKEEDNAICKTQDHNIASFEETIALSKIISTNIVKSNCNEDNMECQNVVMKQNVEKGNMMSGHKDEETVANVECFDNNVLPTVQYNQCNSKGTIEHSSEPVTNMSTSKCLQDLNGYLEVAIIDNEELNINKSAKHQFNVVLPSDAAIKHSDKINISCKSATTHITELDYIEVAPEIFPIEDLGFVGHNKTIKTNMPVNGCMQPDCEKIGSNIAMEEQFKSKEEIGSNTVIGEQLQHKKVISSNTEEQFQSKEEIGSNTVMEKQLQSKEEIGSNTVIAEHLKSEEEIGSNTVMEEQLQSEEEIGSNTVMEEQLQSKSINYLNKKEENETVTIVYSNFTAEKETPAMKRKLVSNNTDINTVEKSYSNSVEDKCNNAEYSNDNSNRLSNSKESCIEIFPSTHIRYTLEDAKPLREQTMLTDTKLDQLLYFDKVESTCKDIPSCCTYPIVDNKLQCPISPNMDQEYKNTFDATSYSNVSTDQIELCDIVDFDETLEEEANNLSQYILNTCPELQGSDSDGDNSKTVIEIDKSVNQIEIGSKISLENSPSTNISHCLEGAYEISVPDCYSCPKVVPIESYMQSMRSVLPLHLNQSEAGPITADELSTQDLGFQDGAKLDLDFFTNTGSTDGILRNSLTRDSLYVKFDPIVGKIVAKTVSDKFNMPLPEEEKIKVEHSETKSGNSRDKDGDAEKTCSRTPALEAVQKLIALTPPSTSSTTTLAKPDRGPIHTPTNATPKSAFISQEQLQKELKILEDLMCDREKYFECELNKRDEYVKKKETELQDLAAKQAELDAELKAASERELRLKKDVQERTKSKQQLSLVMEEYEKTISQLVAQKEEDKKEFEVQKDALINERDTAMQHLNNMEIAFNDVHQKYERSKSVIEGMKANEDMLKRSLSEYNEAIKSSSAKYDSLKNHAIRQLETANQELDVIRRTHQAEIAKLKAMLKKAEVRVTSLEESLEQKSKENQELAAICDELINKVGSGNN